MTSHAANGSGWSAGTSDCVISVSTIEPTYMTIDIQPNRNSRNSTPPISRAR
jgi:hypothetical protein